MPFPWKKVKSARISQLVNDHLHISQKRRDGSSLVVETGFPTSLIDLFFKNREKLKKPSNKKRRNRPISSSDDVYDPAIVGSPVSFPSPPPPPPPSVVGSPMPQRHSSILPPPPSCVDDICVAGSSGRDGGGAVEEEHGSGEEESGGGRDDVSGVLIGVLKVFVVVVLALSTKRLTVGITISAVLLLFLEYVGKHCHLLSTPCAAAKAAAMSIVRSSRRLLTYKKLEPEQQQEQVQERLRFPDHEIQAVESTGVNEIQPEEETVSNSISRNRRRYQEIELLEMAMKREESMRDAADSNRKSRRKSATIKSKMQKIVPKKFRRSKKEQEFHKDEGPIFIDQCEESDNGTISSSSSSVSDRTSFREEEESTVCSDRRLSDADKESHTKIQEKGATEAALARRCMLLCLIVLVGLIGGRPFALGLTLSWFLLLKLGQKLLPRSIK